MIHNTRENNILINDPVPRNVSKFPIHQTYLTSDSERTGTGGYKFKAPEVWSSARSGKKSIAIRSIKRIPKPIDISFDLHIQGDDSEYIFQFQMITPPNYSLAYLIYEIKQRFNVWREDKLYNLEITYGDDHLLVFEVENIQTERLVNIFISEYGDEDDPPQMLNIFLNQQIDYSETLTFTQTRLHFYNVWDRESTLYFHASFIPFDNYQFLGELNDEWNNPIIYQDPNTSPLFNIWTTTDLKTPFPILHENFIIRMTFIISSDSQYHT